MIYLVLCNRNNNDEYESCKKVDFNLMIIGATWKHSDVVRKKIN